MKCTRRGVLSDGQSSSDDSTIRPQLTSLIDVMTILLVFLLQNFSVEGNLISQPQEVDLPHSTIKEQPLLVLALQVTPTTVRLEGKDIVPIATFETSDSLLIPALFSALKKSETPVTTSKRPINIQADKSTPFNVLKRVMYTCNQAGFEDFSVLVMHEDS